MKRHMIAIIAMTAAHASFAESADYEFIAADRTPTTSFCIAAASGDLAGVKKALRDLRQAPHQQHKTIVNAIRCNGEVPAAFAKNYGASETFEYLYRFTQKRYKKMVPVTGVEDMADARTASGPIRVTVVGR